MRTRLDQHRRGIEAPVWVVITTYLLCWGGGAYLLATAGQGDWQRLVVAGFLILWPMSGTTPLELVRAWRGTE